MVYKFSREEKEEVLLRRGYKIVPYTYKKWEQWGNHDSQGDYREINTFVALREGQTPHEALCIDRVFDSLLMQRAIFERNQFLKSL